MGDVYLEDEAASVHVGILMHDDWECLFKDNYVFARIDLRITPLRPNFTRV
jgi:hypothetical protein